MEEILADLHNPDDLQKNLDVVNIVLGFLASGKVKAETSLKDYLKLLQMEKRPFSLKVCYI